MNISDELMQDFNAILKTAQEHRLKPGESLWDVSREYGVTMEQIYEVNPLLKTTDPRKLMAGQPIKIPTSAMQGANKIKGLPLDQQMEAAANFAGVDVNLFKKMIQVESQNCTQNLSGAGAVGCGQLMPETIKMFNLTDAKDTSQNLMASALYLKMMISMAPGDSYEKFWNALMMYNWGPANFKKWDSQGNLPDKLNAEAKNHPKKIFELLGWAIPEKYKGIYTRVPPQVGVSKKEE